MATVCSKPTLALGGGAICGVILRCHATWSRRALVFPLVRAAGGLLRDCGARRSTEMQQMLALLFQCCWGGHVSVVAAATAGS